MKKLLLSIVMTLLATFAHAQDTKVVYHLTTGIDTATGALNNIQNHLNADPKVKIVVVANGLGVDFLISDAKDSRGRGFSGTVSELAGRGVEFRVCNNTLASRNIDPGRLLKESKLVPSGVAEAAMLQAKEHFVYLKP
jgi:intracellular sulfur oxidation DsrE/DsrF family protein